MTKINPTVNFGEQLLAELRDARSRNGLETNKDTPATSSFLDHLKEGIQEVDNLQKTSDSMATDLASGKSQNIHETMLAASQAEISFNLMVQVRNKVLEAYQEVMRMPV